MSQEEGKLDRLSAEFVDVIKKADAARTVRDMHPFVTRRSELLDEIGAHPEAATALAQLLDHPHPRVRLAAAMHCKHIKVNLDAALARLKELTSCSDLHVAEVAKVSLRVAEWGCSAPQVTAPNPSFLPVPCGCSRHQAEEMIKAAFAPQWWQPIIDLLRPAIRIWPKRSSESPIASRYGGLPAAPRSWKWPRLEDEEPLVFLAQINCAELGSLAASLNLPNQGILSFFGHPEDINGAGANGGAVYFFKDLDKLALRRSPIKEDRPPITCDMSFYETNEVPDPASAAFKGLGITREHHRQEWDSYYDLYMALARFGFDAVGEKDEYNDSKLLGWPNLVQNEFDLSPYRLLLQLGSYHDGTERCWWGPGGLLYFTMKPEHLARFEFNRAELEVQCT